MVPNPFLAKVIIKVVTSFTKSAIKAYSNTLRKNNAANGKRAFKFDWNDIFKHHKMNILNYVDASKFKQFNPFTKSSEPGADKSSKNNTHKISQLEAVKILGIDPEVELSMKLVMEQYLLLYTKNKPETGGSAYIQAKVLNAKDMLVESLGGVPAEMKWRAKYGYQDDDNMVFEKKPEAPEEQTTVKDEEAMLEQNLSHREEKKATEEKKENEEEEDEEDKEEKKEGEEEKKNDSDSDDEVDDKTKKVDKEKKEEAEESSKESLVGEFSKFNEDNPEKEAAEEEHIQDSEIESLMKKMDKEQETKENKDNKEKKKL